MDLTGSLVNITANDCEFEKVKFDFFKFVVLGQSLRAGRGLLKFAVVLEKPEGIFENGWRLCVRFFALSECSYLAQCFKAKTDAKPLLYAGTVN